MTVERTHRDGLKLPGYAALREFALRFPEAVEDFPWGHCAIKVRKKIFVSFGASEDGFRMSLKLTESNFEALLLPFTEPTHYGMGKHGWVTSSFAARDKPPLELLRAWVEESYRAIAPKTVVAQLDADGLAPAAKAARKKPPASRQGKPKTVRKAAAKKKAPSAAKPATRKRTVRKKQA